MGVDVRVISGIPVAANFGPQSGNSPNTPIVINSLTGEAYFLNNGVVTPVAGGTGTVTTVSVVTNDGVSGSVANPTTTPAITLTLGAKHFKWDKKVESLLELVADNLVD